MKPLFSSNISKTGRLVRALGALVLLLGAGIGFFVSIPIHRGQRQDQEALGHRRVFHESILLIGGTRGTGILIARALRLCPNLFMPSSNDIRYVAEPKHVREVSLLGRSDFGFWQDYLKREGLVPVRLGEAAQILIVAAEMVYLGIRFTEVSFSVHVAPAGAGAGEGMRLLHAFTSKRIGDDSV